MIINEDIYDLDVLYSVQSPDGSVATYRIADGQLSTSTLDPDRYQKMLDVYWEGVVIKSISPDIVVNKAYCLYGEGYGDFIYYKTNMGDYVYYYLEKPTYCSLETGEFLYSLQAFIEYKQEVVKVMEEWTKENFGLFIGDASSGNTIIRWNLSTYKIGSPNFDPNAPFPTQENNHSLYWIIGCVAAGVCILSVTLLLIRRKQHRSTCKLENS